MMTTTLVIAQESSPSASPSISVPGSSAESGQPLVPGPGGGGAAPASPGGFNPLIMVGVLLVMMLLMTTMTARRDRKKRNALMATMGKHDKVQTSGGIIGTIVELDADSAILRVDESSNTRIRFARSAIVSILKPAKDPATQAKGDVETKPGVKSAAL